ncbi:MAG: hypothetical protein U9N85_03295 [Bacteroidota bacterium]|nr:hypothetical protein [Bacteroidota bacterium]
MVSYKYHKEEDFFEFIYSDVVSYGEVAETIYKLKEKYPEIEYIKFLVDPENADYKLLKKNDPQEEKKLVDALSSYKKVRAGVVHTNTEKTALSVLAEKKLKQRNYEHEIFFSRDAALDWLLA